MAFRSLWPWTDSTSAIVSMWSYLHWTELSFPPIASSLQSIHINRCPCAKRIPRFFWLDIETPRDFSSCRKKNGPFCSNVCVKIIPICILFKLLSHRNGMWILLECVETVLRMDFEFKKVDIQFFHRLTALSVVVHSYFWITFHRNSSWPLQILFGLTWLI